MISLETHSNQINLLNQYIKALEKQISGSKGEVEKVQKNYQDSNSQLTIVTNDLNRHRNQNMEIKKQNIRLNERVKQLSPLQRQCGELQQKLKASTEDKARASAELKKIIDIIKNQEIRLKEKDTQMNERNVAYRQKLQEIQKYQSILKTQGQKYSNEKKIFEASLRQKQGVIAKKDALLQNLQKEMAKIHQQFEYENSNIKDSTSKITQQLSQQLQHENYQKQSVLQKLQQIKEIRHQLQNKVGEQEKEILALKKDIDYHNIIIQQKSKQYSQLLNKSSTENMKNQAIIRKLATQKQEFMKLHSNSQGDLSQNNRALSEAFKKNESLSNTIDSMQLQLQEKNNSVRQLNEQLENLNFHLNNLSSTLMQLQHDKDKLINSNRHQQNTIFSLQNSIVETNLQLQEKKKNLKRLQGQVEQLKREGADKSDDVNQKRKVVQQLQANIVGLRQQLKQLQLVKDRLSAQKKELEQRLSAQQNRSKTLQRQLDEISKGLSQTVSEKESILLQKIGRIESLTLTIKQAQSQNSVLSRSIQTKNAKILSLRQQNTQLSQTISQQNKLKLELVLKLEQQISLNQSNINKSNLLMQTLENQLQQLQQNFNNTKITLEQTNAQYGAFKKRSEKDIEELSHKLEESEKRNERKQGKIKELTVELKDVEQDLNSRLKNTSLSSRQEIEQERARFQRKMAQVSLQNNAVIQRKEEQTRLLKENSKKATQESNNKMKEMIQENKKRQSEYKKGRSDLQNEILLLKQEIKKVTMEISFEGQNKSHQQQLIFNLKSVTEELQSYIKQQKGHISQMLEVLSQKNKEQENLQESNQTLRKQILNLMKNEEDLRKQFLQLKLKSGTVSSNYIRNNSINLRGKDGERNIYKSTFIPSKPKSTRLSGIHEPRRRSRDNSSIYMKQSSEQDLIARGLFFKESTVKDLNESDVQEEEIFDTILNCQLQNSRHRQ